MPSPAISFSSSIAKDHKPIPQSTNSTHLIYLNPTHLGRLSISLTLIPCHISKCLLSLFFILFLSTPLPQAVFPTMLLRKDIRFLNFLVTSPLYLKNLLSSFVFPSSLPVLVPTFLPLQRSTPVNNTPLRCIFNLFFPSAYQRF